MDKKKFKILKIIITILVIIFLAFLTIKLIPIFKSLSTESGRIEFKENISNGGIKGIIIISMLMVAQILLAFLPGEPIELLAGMCYGPIGGMLVIFLGSFICSLIIFTAVRKYGRSFAYTFIGEDKIKKIEEKGIFKDTNKIELIMFIVFFTPCTPKDLFVYIAGLLPINPVRFLIISTFARFPSVISSTLAGSSIVNGLWSNVIFIYLISYLLAAIILFIVILIKRYSHKLSSKEDI